MTSPNAGTSSPWVINVDLADNLTAQMVMECYKLSGVKQETFARLMGVSRASLGRWLAGSSRVPSWASRAAVCAACVCGIPIRIPNPSQYFFPPGTP
jgi:DNA-binding XRE family transcriptional regulator